MLDFENACGSREDRRQRLRSDAAYHWVTADEWKRLVVSHGSLERTDFLDAGVRGLLDRESGDRFVIEEEQLLN